MRRPPITQFARVTIQGELYFGLARDVQLSRLAANVLGLAAGDALALDTLYFDSANRDIALTRRAANKLQMGAGDHLELDEIYLDATNRDVRLYRVSANVLGLSGGLQLGGDLTLGTNRILGGTMKFKEIYGDGFASRNAADDGFAHLYGRSFYVFENIYMYTNAASINANNTNGHYVLWRARKTGDQLVEVGSQRGDVDPWIGLGVNGAVLKATNAGLLGLFGATPVSQRLKANYNNWAAVGDVVDALVALGAFDQS